MKITEKQLRGIIRESLNRIMEGGMSSDELWNKYGNRSVVPDAGVEHEDDKYTRQRMNSGELSMQAQNGLGLSKKSGGNLWKKNGRSGKWRSPKQYGSAEEVLTGMRFVPSAEGYEKISNALNKGRNGIFTVNAEINGQEFISPLFTNEERAFGYAEDFTNALESVGFDLATLNAYVTGYWLENGKIEEDACGDWVWDEEFGGFWND